MRWIALGNVEKDFDGLMSVIVREQYLESCPVQLAIFLRERKPKDLSELATLADQYLDAHASNKKEWKGNQCLEVICLPQLRESLEAVAEVRELLNRK